MRQIMDNTAKLYDFFGEYAAFMEDMESVQKEKLDSLLSRDLLRMERSIKSQQAYAMRLENIENRRIRVQEEAGLGGLTFSELISRAPEEKRRELSLLFDRVKRSVSNIKYLNDKASELASMNLRGVADAASGESNAHRIDTKV